jgi:hypothetical protein
MLDPDYVATLPDELVAARDVITDTESALAAVGEVMLLLDMSEGEIPATTLSNPTWKAMREKLSKLQVWLKEANTEILKMGSDQLSLEQQAEIQALQRELLSG